MKTIGLIGGMSWESTVEYYRIINQEVKARLGKLHSGRILLYSVDFEEIENQQRAGLWDEAAGILIDAAQRLEKGGADFILICTNTMHKVAPQVRAAVKSPLVHIADSTALEIKTRGLSAVGLLGTRFTMEQDFLKGLLAEKYGLKILVPDRKGRDLIHDIIYQELCLGDIRDDSRQKALEVIEDLKRAGAEGVILGCTELPLLIRAGDTDLPVFDTTFLHARQAVDLALD